MECPRSPCNLRKVQQVCQGVRKPKLAVTGVLVLQEWAYCGSRAVLSPSLEAAHGKHGLSANAGMDLRVGQLVLLIKFSIVTVSSQHNYFLKILNIVQDSGISFI